ncbi:hypothetical protein GCM10010172_86980 [Paractinoplanes ferrugineus]|uniref:Uncharacterized protein n=1 Tax=Paractinoplanes ferrugineus TaxID=113564 RepID=A0A919J8P4_9ACTN|nr:hypothetical protein [Actinoplanes ferrugineus]GIE15088.1 hypothetical protein Afe05nite_69280 [Actinoplanes ferrugineus]
MTTIRIIAADLAALGLLALGAGHPGMRWWLSPLLLFVLLATGELWLRVLIPEAVAPVARIGIDAVCGLVSLPLVTLVLHLLAVPVRAGPTVAGLALLAAVLGGGALRRERSGRAPDDPRLARTLAAIAIPAVVTLIVGGSAAIAYVRLPHPPQPGFTSLALGGWAAGIGHPVTFPRRGLEVPVEVRSSGRPGAVARLRVSVGDRPAGAPREVPVEANTTRSFTVHVPSPLTGCLTRIEISVGGASTVFYGRGPAAC